MRQSIAITPLIVSLILISIPNSTNAGCKETEPTSWKFAITADDEPGEKIIVRGRVFSQDGKPATGITVYAYHTDNDGKYQRDKNNEARLCGIVRTDSLGNYRFETIRPVSYPGSNIAAHVHFVLWGEEIKEQTALLEFGEEFEFNQNYRDRYGPNSERKERTATVRPLALDSDSVWHCARDLQLKP